MDFNKFSLHVLEVLHNKFHMDFIIEDGKIRKVIYND